ncbi:TOMM system kinase/cyclase fusion protein [Pseudoalteromonas luteoviolacea]|uniref:Uncharacterized protein n=1 Tax=Pseudoalteromonas luteoviolacea H33 TaxID=1365251 RepID=A0A161XX50_9GAMM|nr:TOMM system kinase/cyclase fusion protein [Pseudoalteromonas luteoviolacea]KZN47859.1 hypothetical protein N476_22810 [Pseudoalteromonas luteoviolacea H33]KZN74647.1 hypothetical protein N477_21705 [Pseudoalteromonas luteoviolacea H33-S]
MSLTHFSDPYIENNFDSSQYELLHKIGEGGFGKVYKARNKNTEQTVAIKFLALEPHLEESKKKRYVERFKRETALSGQLEHPHIVRLLDKGQVNEHLLYGVFEYIEGQSLREYLMQEGALDAVEATDIMLQVLDALIHAHKKGIIHRDIKPANIMLTQAGAKIHAKILDFGIGTLTQESRHQDFATITLTQETIGTPSYSAPEQLRGEPASEKTDLYVWGLVLLECLTGMPAVTGSSIASIYHKQLSDVHIPIPSALLGHPLSGLLRRVLQKNATERVISGKEVFTELNSMNVSNLVGILADVHAQHGYDDNTVVLRNDDPNHVVALDYTTLTERKQITVLAVRLSAKIVTGESKDLDIIDTLFRSQRNHCIDIATRFGAYHVGNLADTMLFYFGYPVASDNDTRLSARTALEAISELAKRNALMQEAHGIQLNAHVGIHSGIFVTYANAVPEGNVANIAMELSRLAGERQILCSAETRSILEPFSEFDYFDNIQLGLSIEQLTVYNLNGEKRIEAFGFMRGTKNHHKLVGRQHELDKTLSIINDENTKSRIAHIFGEAGIGKSRLLQEIRDNASQYQHLVAQCLPEHQNNGLYPVINLVKYLYNIQTLSHSEIVAKFTTLLSSAASDIDVTHMMPVLLVWLNVELPEHIQPSSLNSESQKALLFKGLASLLSTDENAICNNKLYVFEDIHWSDATTLEFIQFFAESLDGHHVLISTSRQPAPNCLHDLTLLEIELNKLTSRATEDFIEQLFENKSVSNSVRNVLINRTDGIPLFIEELVDMMKQKGLVHEQHGAIQFISPDKQNEVPGSLRESLQQKLDCLVHAKETAQLAATIGREFDYDLLVAASSLSEDQIQNDLNELIDKDLIVQQRRVDSDSYIFKHALVRDAAYESQSSKEFKGKHLQILSALETLNHFDRDPLLTTFHLKKVGQFNEAVTLLLHSAKQATTCFFVAKASSFYAEALEIINAGNIEDNALATSVKNALAASRIAYNGWLDSQAVSNMEENIRKMEEIQDPTQKFFTQRGQWLHAYASGDMNVAHQIGIGIAKKTDDLPSHVHPIIAEVVVQTHFSFGEFDTVLSLIDSLPKRGFFDNSPEAISANFGFCSELVCIGFKGLSELLLGLEQQADETMRDQLLLARQLNVEDVLSATHGFQAWYFLLKSAISTEFNDFNHSLKNAKLHSEQGYIHSQNTNNIGWLGYNTMLKYLANIDTQNSFEHFEENIAQFMGYQSHRYFYYFFLAKFLFLRNDGRYEDAYAEYISEKSKNQNRYLNQHDNL